MTIVTIRRTVCSTVCLASVITIIGYYDEQYINTIYIYNIRIFGTVLGSFGFFYFIHLSFNDTE